MCIYEKNSLSPKWNMWKYVFTVYTRNGERLLWWHLRWLCNGSSRCVCLKYLHKARCQICLKQEKLLFLVVSERTLHVKYCLLMFFSPWEGWLVAIELIASSFSTLFLFVHYFERCKWCHSGHIQVLLLPLVRECFTDVSCNQIGLGWLANTPCVK